MTEQIAFMMGHRYPDAEKIWAAMDAMEPKEYQQFMNTVWPKLPKVTTDALLRLTAERVDNLLGPFMGKAHENH